MSSFTGAHRGTEAQSASSERLNELTGAVIEECIRIHKELGPGLLESVYEIVLCGALVRRGLNVERLANLHAKQLLTYLRLTNSPLGLLLNFSGETMKEGIRRVAN